MENVIDVLVVGYDTNSTTHIGRTRIGLLAAGLDNAVEFKATPPDIIEKKDPYAVVANNRRYYGIYELRRASLAETVVSMPMVMVDGQMYSPLLSEDHANKAWRAVLSVIERQDAAAELSRASGFGSSDHTYVFVARGPGQVPEKYLPCTDVKLESAKKSMQKRLFHAGYAVGFGLSDEQTWHTLLENKSGGETKGFCSHLLINNMSVSAEWEISNVEDRINRAQALVFKYTASGIDVTIAVHTTIAWGPLGHHRPPRHYLMVTVTETVRENPAKLIGIPMESKTPYMLTPELVSFVIDSSLDDMAAGLADAFIRHPFFLSFNKF